MKSSRRTFKTKDNLELIVIKQKSSIIFEIGNENDMQKYRFRLEFDINEFDNLLKHLENISSEIWKNFRPKEANTMSADYDEYYDKELDNNGYLRIQKNVLFIEKPSKESNRLYKFSKGKMESFIYDFRRYQKGN